MKKHVIFLVLVLSLTLGLQTGLSLTAAAAESGTCGSGLTWVLDDEGTLTISGSGEMYNYTYPYLASWNSSGNSVINVIIKNGVTSIGQEAFVGCSSLTSITISDSVTSIGNYAFYDCSSLTSITVADGNANYSSMDGVLFDKAMTTLIQYPANKANTTYDIPNSVTSIGYDAFFGCTGLTSVTIPDSVTSISHSAFYGCSRLTSITIPDSVTSIGGEAFVGCRSLTNITIPDGVTSIGDWAFSGCTGLTSVAIPDSVTTIGYGAFGECDGLADVYYGGSEEEWSAISIDSANSGLTNATIHYNSMIPKLAVDASGAVILRAEGVTEAATVYLAAYDDEGGFVGLQKLVLTEGTAQATVSLDGVARLKAFIWKEDTFSPYCIPGECVVP